VPRDAMSVVSCELPEELADEPLLAVFAPWLIC